MNKVILCGRLTRDAEARVGGANQQTITRFTIAVDRRFVSAERRQQGAQTADFISCVAFGTTATFMEKYGRKGTKFIVEGRIQTGSYQDKDGRTVYTTDVVVENVEFAESRAAEGGTIGAAAPVGGSQGGFTPNDVPSDGFINIADGIEEELPFS